MSKVNFNYDINKDAWSWALIAKDKNMWGLNWRDQIAQIPDELLEKIEKADFSYAQKIIEEYIDKDPKKNTKIKLCILKCGRWKKRGGLLKKNISKHFQK